MTISGNRETGIFPKGCMLARMVPLVLDCPRLSVLSGMGTPSFASLERSRATSNIRAIVCKAPLIGLLTTPTKGTVARDRTIGAKAYFIP
jgi:hypothetical protein